MSNNSTTLACSQLTVYAFERTTFIELPVVVTYTIDNQRNGLETRYDWDANSVIRAIT